ncbi:hypothetical protein Q3G72_024815 [Acer saccharum]|nr:hypothetical protein Q3G72_024815 [Acer saccharum]
MRTFIEKQGDKATRPTTTSDNNARGTGQQPRPTAKAEQQEQSHQATTNRSVSQRKGKVWTILLYKLSLVVVAMSSRETKTVWKVCNFSSAASSTNNVPPLDRRKEFLKDGDFWGEELLNWVQDESSSSSSSNKLISQTTIQALTKVEAFVLRIDDLKNLYNEKAKILQSWFRKRRIRISERNTQEKTPPPPGDQLTAVIESDAKSVVDILSRFLISILWVPRVAHAWAKLALDVDGFCARSQLAQLKSSPNLVQNPEHVPGQQQPSQPHKDQQHRTNEEHWAGVNDEELPNQVDLSQDDGDDPLWGRNTGGRL